MITVSELNHVAVHVRDLERSMAFYGGILGLPEIPRPAFPFPGAWYALGSQELHLILDEALEPGTRLNHHFALRVEDPHAAKAYLESRGLTWFRGPAPRPDGAIQLFITDPDSYMIELFSGP